MRKTVTSLLAGTVLMTSATFAADLDSDLQKRNYMIGSDVGAYIKKSGMEFDTDSFVAGVKDAIAGGDLQLNAEQIAEIRKALQEEQRAAAEKQRAEMMAKLEEDKVKNLELGKAFMDKKAKEKGVMSTESGMLYEVVEQGDGAKPSSANSTVVVHYTGTLIDGTEFDSSVKRGQPATFALNQVIKGWTEGLQLMNAGSKYRFYIPPEMAYGSDARPGSPIGPNSTLIFDVELIEVKE
ncbi:MAG: FKBP-type peptidyl-prolyl cis-trans isomerase [Gammaproteobacteria bacterium]|jgi:FKBP-type peptidyl-prolyl cis-trans isomerase|nr:FKBP-type peptidyl-prolyl cis-trans isomerase [Xanthomonadales bacterium]MCB1603727.1 FKBP-type peptidyl-prolyl cis-trans isomerase [Xanthomonadales bacterium]